MCVEQSLNTSYISKFSILENVRTEGGFSLRHLRHNAKCNRVWGGWTWCPRTQPPLQCQQRPRWRWWGLWSSYKHTGFSRGSGGRIRALKEKGGEPEQ